MLSDRDQRVWEQIDPSLVEEAGEAVGPRGSPPAWQRLRPAVRAAAGLLGGVSVLLVGTGAAGGGLALALAAALTHGLWHCWPDLAVDAVAARGGRPRDPAGRGPGGRRVGPGTVASAGGGG